MATGRIKRRRNCASNERLTRIALNYYYQLFSWKNNGSVFGKGPCLVKGYSTAACALWDKECLELDKRSQVLQHPMAKLKAIASESLYRNICIRLLVKGYSMVTFALWDIEWFELCIW